MTARGLLFTPLFLAWTMLKCLSYSRLILFPPRSFIKYLVSYENGLAWLERNVLGLTWELEGELPRSGAGLIAMKHQSLWETMKIHLLFDNPAIVLKKELLDIPLWGRYAAMTDIVPVDRSAGHRAIGNMLEVARRARDNDRPIVIFPQGTRVPPGERRPYKKGLARLYAETGLPITPVALNSGLFWPKKLFRQRSGKITMRVLEQIPPGLDPDEAMRILEDRLERASDALIEQWNNRQ